MNRVWKKIVEASFPGTYEEYQESKKIHNTEIKRYRKNPQYLIGLILYSAPLFYMVFFMKEWSWRIIALMICIGEMLIRDTVSEHYCALINKERKISLNNATHSDGHGSGT